MGVDLQASVMDAGRCERHSGAQPGGGICATCLQERLVLLWRGEGNSNWNTEEFCITPPLHCRTPPAAACEPSDARAGVTACFPMTFRVRNLRRDDDAHESSKLDTASYPQQQQFSCELGSLVKELAGLHEKKKLDRGVKKQHPGTDSGCLSSRRHQHDVEVPGDVTQGPASASPGVAGDTAKAVAKAKVSILGVDDDEDEDEGAKYSKVTCFSAVWPAIINTKWARVLGSPVVVSSNKIAPSKSDLLSKLVTGLPKAAAMVDNVARHESGRNCETSGSLRPNKFNNDLRKGFSRDYAGLDFVMPSPALLPPRHLHPPADEDTTTVVEMDKETRQRMEASRITVMTWLQSLPSPKAVHLSTEHNYNYNYPREELLPHEAEELLSVGNEVLEMCDEEEFDCGGHTHPHAPDSATNNNNKAAIKLFDSCDTTNAVEHDHITSFGKFLRTTPSPIYAPPRLVDIDIAAQ